MFLKTIRYKQFDSLELKESLFNEFILPDHFHDTYCIGLLCEGIKKSVVEGDSKIIHSNTVSIVNPYQVHSDQNIDNANCHFRMLYLNKDAVNSIAKKIGLHYGNISFTNELITDPLVSQALLDFFTRVSDESLLEGKLLNLFELLLRNYMVDDDSCQDKCITFQNAIGDSVAYARQNFKNKIDINKMAADCKLSKYQFIRYFKKQTGLTPAVYMIICRINYAKELLLKGFPIGQLALEAGFYDHSQYCKFFKYYTGIAPHEYQKSCNIIQAGIIH